MGEVWRARDTNLRRDVALKVLPDLFASDSERLTRFRREAQVLASLNHPNIAIIHGFEESSSVRALVLEFVDGPTLADRIARGAIPVDEALPIAKQICEALEAAHRQGIVHRDLKPANIKLRPDGTVKVLDFGLAKALAPDADDSGQRDLSRSPTITTPGATRIGVVMGTAAYMSPEQARGHAVDEQADIWAFGVVLYEMLTGRPAFTGETVTDVLGGIVKTEPDWAALPTDTPSTVRLLLRQCLQKQRVARLHHIGDARIAIDAVASDPSITATIARPRHGPGRRAVGWFGAAVLMTVAGAAGALLFQRSARPESTNTGVVRLALFPPPNTTFAGGPNTPYFTMSPDGRHLAFIASSRGIGQVWVRSLDTLEPRPLAGTEGVAPYPTFWSPDSRFVAYFTTAGKLRKIDVAGGPPQTVSDASIAMNPSGAWNSAGVIVFGGGNEPLKRVSAAGGTPQPVTILDQSRQEQAHHWPTFLPDGDHFFFLARSATPENNAIFIGSLSSRETKFVISADSRIAYDPSGHLLFVREGSLMAVPLDTTRLLPAGDPVLVAANVRFNPLGQSSLTVSNNGVLAYRTGDPDRYTLLWFDRSGKELGTVGSIGAYQNVELSPDDKRVAISRSDSRSQGQDLWVIDASRGSISRLTFGVGQANAVWSPDGERIAFHTLGNPIYVKHASGAGSQELLVKVSGMLQDWSSDGKYVISSDRTSIWATPLTDDRKPVQYLPGAGFSRGQPQLSFDGRWLAYQSNESGRYEIYIQSFPTPSFKAPISTTGGRSPRWRRDGKEIFYLSEDGKLMAVSVSPSANTMEISRPTPLFDIAVIQGGRPEYDVTGDGQRFLVNSIANTTGTPVTVVLNWTAGMKKQE
jgi:Tol biopolymer transport system component